MTSITTGATTPPAAALAQRSSHTEQHCETCALLALLLLANLGMIVGHGPDSRLMFDPAAVAGGAWWRIASWPWVHVSRYHLLLDGIAFLLLYHGLQAESRVLRLGYLFAVTTGSLLLPLVAAPQLARYGLCGLSGPAHGLLAISALELAARSNTSRLGRWLLAGVLAKTAWELCTGHAFLQQWHFGDIGVPIVTTHAGGLVGGLLAFSVGRYRQATTQNYPEKIRSR